MRKILLIVVLFLFVATGLFSAINQETADKIAYRTVTVLSQINMILQKIKKTEDITADIKKEITQNANELRKIKSDVIHLRRTNTEEQMKILNSRFHKGPYSIALKKVTRDFFVNINRISAIRGGKEIAKMLVI